MRMGLSISNIGENLYLFKFGVEEDFRRIYNRRPWTGMGNHMVLKQWFTDARIEDIVFVYSEF